MILHNSCLFARQNSRKPASPVSAIIPAFLQDNTRAQPACSCNATHPYLSSQTQSCAVERGDATCVDSFPTDRRSFRNLLARVVKKRDPASSLLLSAHDCSVGRLDLHLTVCVLGALKVHPHCHRFIWKKKTLVPLFPLSSRPFRSSLLSTVINLSGQAGLSKHNHWELSLVCTRLLSVSHLTCLLHLSSCS